MHLSHAASGFVGAVNKVKDLIDVAHSGVPFQSHTACPLRGLLLLAVTSHMDGGRCVASGLFQLWEPNEIISKRQAQVAINWCFSLLLSPGESLLAHHMWVFSQTDFSHQGNWYAVVPGANALG